jgi:hypothetical protein
LRCPRTNCCKKRDVTLAKLDVPTSGTGCASFIISDIRRRLLEVNSMLRAPEADEMSSRRRCND